MYKIVQFNYFILVSSLNWCNVFNEAAGVAEARDHPLGVAEAA